MAQSTHTAAALTPLTVTFDEQTVDLSVPQLSPLAELIPTILRSLGRMDVYGASAGFTVSTSSGQVLDQSLVSSRPGRARRGQPCRSSAPGRAEKTSSFDDLVEAVGSAVETTVDPVDPPRLPTALGLRIRCLRRPGQRPPRLRFDPWDVTPGR